MNDLSFVIKQLVGGMPDLARRLEWWVSNFRFRVSQAVDRLRSGKITLAEFQSFGRDELKDTYYGIAETGKGAPLTPKEMAQVRVTLKEQIAHWDNFCQDIAGQRKVLADKGLKGDELEEAFNNLYDKFDRRAQSYAGAVEAQGEEWAMAGMYKDGQWFRWVRSPVESCPTCLKRDGGVWQMKDGRLPFYPRDGQSECLYNCLCRWEPISRFKALALRALGKLKQVFRRKSFEEIAEEWLEKGGAGSGHWGHAGRQGKRGGSAPRSQAMSAITGREWQARQRAARTGQKTGASVRAEMLTKHRRSLAEIKKADDRAAKLAKEWGDLLAKRREINWQTSSALSAGREEEVVRLGKEYDRVVAKLKTVGDKQMAAARAGNDIRERVRLDAIEMLKVDNPARFDADVGKMHKGKAEIQEGIEGFRQLVGTGTLDGKAVKVKRGKGQRARYDMASSVEIPTGEGSTATVHELGHWLEDMDPRVHSKALEFLHDRTAGEKLAPLRSLTGASYRSWETTRKDRFLHPYMGKDYGDRATEIVSMGLEYMYAKPVELADKDPGYFDFMYDLMRGQ